MFFEKFGEVENIFRPHNGAVFNSVHLIQIDASNIVRQERASPWEVLKSCYSQHLSFGEFITLHGYMQHIFVSV